MAQKRQALLGCALMLMGVAAVGGLALGALSITKRTLQGIDPNIAAALVAALATIAVSAFSVVLSRWLESRAQVARELREKKIPIYEKLLSFMFQTMGAVKKGGAPSEAEMGEFFVDFTREAIVWGSDSVIAKYVAFRRATPSESNPESNTKFMLALEGLILQIRKDLGHKNTGIQRGDLLSMFITDIDKQLQSEEEST